MESRTGGDQNDEDVAGLAEEFVVFAEVLLAEIDQFIVEQGRTQLFLHAICSRRKRRMRQSINK